MSTILIMLLACWKTFYCLWDFSVLKINRELTQLNKVCLLFWLGLLSVSFMLLLHICFKLLLLFRTLPDFSYSACIVLFLVSALVVLHFVLSTSLFLHILFFPLLQVPLCWTFPQSASPPLTTADDLGEDFRPQMYFYYCFQLHCHLTSDGYYLLFQASQQPKKGNKGWGCFSCLEELLSAEPEWCSNHVIWNIDNPHIAPLSSEYSVVRSFNKKWKVVLGKTRREGYLAPTSPSSVLFGT